MKKLLLICLLLISPIANAENHNAFPSVENLGADTIMVVFRSGQTHISSDGVIKAFRGYYSEFDDTLKTYDLFTPPSGVDYRDPSIRMMEYDPDSAVLNGDFLTPLSETVALYHFDGNLLDFSGHGNHLTGVNLDDSDYVQGINTNSIGIAVTGDFGPNPHPNSEYAYINNDYASDLDMGMSDFTVEAIIKPEAGGDSLREGIVNKREYGNVSKPGWGLELRGANRICCDFGDGTNGIEAYWYVNPLADGTWYYLAVTVDRDAGQARLYVNGVPHPENPKDISSVTGSLSNATKDFTIAHHISNPHHDFTGIIEGVCLTKRVLSVTEIAVRSRNNQNDVLILTFDDIDPNTGRNDILLTRSYDKGLTWTGFENATGDKLDSHRWWTSSELVQTKSHVWILPLYRWEPKFSVWSAGSIRSTDFGVTWQDYVAIVYGSSDTLAPSEPSVAQLDDGTLFMLAREDNFEHRMYYSYSFDEGQSWMPAQFWSEPGAAPWVGKDVDGGIVVSYGAKGPWGVAMTKSLNSSYPLEWGEIPRVVPYTNPATYNYPSLCRIESLSNDTSSCFLVVHHIERDHNFSNLGHTLAYEPIGHATGITETANLPIEISVTSYPNPFNAFNILKVNMPKKEKLTVDLFNLMGQRVSSIFDGIADIGNNQFTFNASDLSSGTYFYLIKAGSSTHRQKMTLIK